MNAGSYGNVGAEGIAVGRQFRRLGVAAALLVVCFASPLLQLVSFAWRSELFSCILLVPFISGYLIWSIRKSLNVGVVRPCWAGAALGWAAGGTWIAGYWVGRHGGWRPEPQDYLALMTLAFLCCFWGLCLAILGRKLSGQILFPLAFLVFAAPMPTSWEEHIDTFFQYASAIAAEGFFNVVREPVLRSGLNLQLPGFGLRVAPECSGIHSTLVLLMTGFLASYLFLRRCWSRTALVLAVIPLAIARNGFRVFVVGWLCVHIGPEMIQSPIHRRGGPIFFVLSLIPFFLLLLFLRKRDFHAHGISKIQTES